MVCELIRVSASRITEVNAAAVAKRRAKRKVTTAYTILYPKIRMSGRITWDHSTMLYARVPRADKCHAVENMGMARVYVIG